MKFRIIFAVSKTERKYKLRFGKWDIWRLDSGVEEEGIKKDFSKAGFVSFRKETQELDEPEDSEANYGKLLFQALFYPEVEHRIWRFFKKLFAWIFKLFSVGFENVEVRGSLDDPFYDAIALGVSGGCYYPNWEGEKGDWSAKGEVVLKLGFFRLLLIEFALVYETVALAFIIWRGVRLAKNNPNGENMDDVRRWIFLKCNS